MEFEGTVYKILPVTKGTSARGEWQRQDVVFEMNEGSFTRKICVTFFNKPEDVARLKEGSTYNVSVNIESREYNGRWYTDIRAWRLQPKQEAAAAPMPDMPPIAEEPSYASAPAQVDDLPFYTDSTEKLRPSMIRRPEFFRCLFIKNPDAHAHIRIHFSRSDYFAGAASGFSAVAVESAGAGST